MAASATIVSVPAIRGDEKQSPDPWTSAQVVQAAALAHELDDKNGAAPTVVYVGFHTLFAGGHIPGAAFQGPASTEKGLANLKKLADGLPRTTNLVIYCGCCPFGKCPNVRRSRKTVRPLFQIRQTLLGGCRALERSSWNMAAGE